MTYDEFLAALRKTPRDWRLEGCALRRGERGHHVCPIAAVTGCDDDLANPWSAASRLGLSADEGRKIVNAADHFPSISPGIRADLLAACGIKEDER